MAGILNIALEQRISIEAGASATISNVNGVYYLYIYGDGVINGVLLVRTRYSLTILAKSSFSNYDKMTVTSDGESNIILTNTADVPVSVTYRRL